MIGFLALFINFTCLLFLSLLLDDKHFHLLLDAIPPIPTVSSYERLGVNAVQRGGGVVYHVRVLGRAHPLAPSDAEDLHAFWSHELSKIVSLIGGIRGKISIAKRAICHTRMAARVALGVRQARFQPMLAQNPLKGSTIWE